jgi:hypothetical protein
MLRGSNNTAAFSRNSLLGKKKGLTKGLCHEE